MTHDRTETLARIKPTSLLSYVASNSIQSLEADEVGVFYCKLFRFFKSI